MLSITFSSFPRFRWKHLFFATLAIVLVSLSLINSKSFSIVSALHVFSLAVIAFEAIRQLTFILRNSGENGSDPITAHQSTWIVFRIVGLSMLACFIKFPFLELLGAFMCMLPVFSSWQKPLGWQTRIADGVFFGTVIVLSYVLICFDSGGIQAIAFETAQFDEIRIDIRRESSSAQPQPVNYRLERANYSTQSLGGLWLSISVFISAIVITTRRKAWPIWLLWLVGVAGSICFLYRIHHDGLTRLFASPFSMSYSLSESIQLFNLVLWLVGAWIVTVLLSSRVQDELPAAVWKSHPLNTSGWSTFFVLVAFVCRWAYLNSWLVAIALAIVLGVWPNWNRLVARWHGVFRVGIAILFGMIFGFMFSQSVSNYRRLDLPASLHTLLFLLSHGIVIFVLLFGYEWLWKIKRRDTDTIVVAKYRVWERRYFWMIPFWMFTIFLLAQMSVWVGVGILWLSPAR